MNHQSACLFVVPAPAAPNEAQPHEIREIVIVCTAEDSLGLAKEEITGFHSVRLIEMGDIKTTSRARAAAIRAASGPVVALAEDHAFPEPDWAEVLIRAHRQPWAAVGPA